MVFLILPANLAFAETTNTKFGVAAEGVSYGIIILLGWIFTFFFYILGLISTLIIDILVQVASYSQLINVPAVTTGWKMVRDLCNMFFVLILLVIAFATILRVETYQWKKALPKLLIMAILINFSKTICGLFIDFAQVIMLTFVNAFSAGGGNLVDTLQIQKYTSIGGKLSDVGAVGAWNTVGSMFAALFALIISLIVLIVLLAVLVMRVVMLWIYVILSPLAFLASAFPQGQKYASQWWGEFSKQVIVGPVLAFFIWLALLTANQSGQDLISYGAKSREVLGKEEELCAGLTSLFCSNNFQTYIITIGLLIGGLMVTQQVGGIAGSIAGKGLAWAKKAPMLMGKGISGFGAWGTRKIAAAKHGIQLNPFEIGRQIKTGLEIKKQKDLQKGKTRGKQLLEKGGIRGLVGGLGAGADWTENYIGGVANWKGFKEMFKTVAPGGGIRSREKKFEERAKLEAQLKELGDVYRSDEEKQADKDRIEDDLEILRGNKKRISDEIDNRGNLGLSDEDVKKREEELKKNDAMIESKGKELGAVEAKGVDAKRLDLEVNIKKIDEGLEKRMPPRGFEGRAAERTLINEEKKKIADITHVPQLLSYLRSAMASKDRHKAIAIMEKMTSDANENEWLNAFGYDSTAVGLHKFTQEKLMDELGMDKQEALAVQSDIGGLAEKTGHWEVARTVGTKADGSLTSLIKGKEGNWDDSAHAQESFAEIMKMDPQVIARALNRLAYGGERPRKDGSGRDFMVTSLGLMLSRALGDTSDFVAKHANRYAINSAQNLSTVTDELRKAGVSEEFIEMVKRIGFSKTGLRLSPDEVYKAVTGQN